MFIVLKKLSWFFRMQWKRYAIAIILLTVVGILDVIPPKLIGFAIDGIHQETLTAGKLTQLLIFWVALTVVGYGMTYIWLYQLFGGAFVLERLLRSPLMRHLLKITPTF